jgi:hypothetical protein
MRLFGLAYDSNDPVAWVIALLLIAAAIVLGRLWAPRFSQAFARAAQGEVTLRDSARGVMR